MTAGRDAFCRDMCTTISSEAEYSSEAQRLTESITRILRRSRNVSLPASAGDWVGPREGAILEGRIHWGVEKTPGIERVGVADLDGYLNPEIRELFPQNIHSTIGKTQA